MSKKGYQLINSDDTVTHADGISPSNGATLRQVTNRVPLPISGSTTTGTSVVYLTTNGLVGGTPIFASVSYVHLDLVSNDPNLGKSYTLSGVTLTITITKQTFTGITLLSTPILGSVTLLAAPNGTLFTGLVEGVRA